MCRRVHTAPFAFAQPCALVLVLQLAKSKEQSSPLQTPHAAVGTAPLVAVVENTSQQSRGRRLAARQRYRVQCSATG